MKARSTKLLIIILFLSIGLLKATHAQETVSGGYMWTYDIPETKETQFQRVLVDFKYELSTEKIGDRYRVWAKYKFVPQFTHIQPALGGAYNYKYNGKWYNSDEMWRVDPRTNDGFMNTYGFVPDVKVTQVSMSGTIIGDKDALFFAVTSDSYHTVSADLGYIADPKQLRSVVISPQNTKINYISTSGTGTLHKRIGEYERKLTENKQFDDLVKKADMAFRSKNYQEAQGFYQQALNIRKNDTYITKQLGESQQRLEDENKKQTVANTSKEAQTTSVQSGTSTSNTTGGSGAQSNQSSPSKEDIAEQQRVARNREILQQYERREQRSTQRMAETQQVATDLTNMVTGILASNQRMREENEARDQIRREQREAIRAQNYSKGKLLLDNNLAAARNGNEDAIKNVDAAYFLMNDDEERIDFLKKQYNTFNSDNSRQSLITHYGGIMRNVEYFYREEKKEAWRKVIWGGVLMGGAYLGADQYIKAAPDNEVLDIVVPVATALVGVGGFVLSLWGGATFPGNIENDEDYINARENIDKLQNKRTISVRVSPYFERSPMVGMNHSGVTLVARF